MSVSKSDNITYCGVSRNGHFGWQIMCIVERRQQFIATVENKDLAALIHDFVQIQNNGLRVKTNFNYTIRDLLALLCMPSLLDVRQVVYSPEASEKLAKRCGAKRTSEEVLSQDPTLESNL